MMPAQLVSAELIFRRGSRPTRVYTFKHALIEDVAYDTLLRTQRQQIHARIAATLESQFRKSWPLSRRSLPALCQGELDR